MSNFKKPFAKKTISAEVVAAAEEAAGSAPIVGDPRSPTHVQAASSHTSQFVPEPIPGGQILDVPLAQIKSNPVNPRAVYTSAAVEEMAASMTAHGQRVAALGFRDASGSVTLIEGETRFRGARAAGLATLRVEIRPAPKDDKELYEWARSANVERREQTPLDDAIRWKELIQRKIYKNQAELATALNIPEAQISRCISLAQLTSRIVTTLSDFPDLLNLKMLTAIREYCDQQGEEDTLNLIQDVVKNGLGYREVDKLRFAAARGPIKRPRAEQSAITYAQVKGSLKLNRKRGEIVMAFKGVPDEMVALFEERLQGFLDELGHK
jgi:ParB family chromosome partitioning protein